MEDYGLDGLDVDYEYPQNDAQATGYVHLLRELRTALDEHARRKRADYHFLLTVSVPIMNQSTAPLRRDRLQLRVGQTTTTSYTSGK